jgi:hypothetical protein
MCFGDIGDFSCWRKRNGHHQLGQFSQIEDELPPAPSGQVPRGHARIGREVAEVVERDYFPGKAREQMESALADAQAALDTRFSPDEPRPRGRKIKRLNANEYRGRTWATRERLWIDRVASAWLIRRFIGPQARFVWLKRVKDCAKRAVGFDFDGAQFTHVDAKVTFEVLVASFGLESDPGLARLGALVHHLDVGGIPTADGAGFVTIMTGARALHANNNSLLDAMTPVIDSLYAAYSMPRDEGRK